MMALLKDAWDRFLLYLPVSFMGLLALGTYWLVRNTPAPSVPAAPHAVSHSPDYFMQEFSVRTFDAGGRIRSELQGDKARHYLDTQWLEVDNIRIRSFDRQGRLTTASARRGLANEDISEVQLFGDAVLVREANATLQGSAAQRTEFRGEFLHIFAKTEKITSNQPVQLLRGNDSFSADSLHFDNVEQQLQLHGHVRVTLAPTGSK